MSNLNMGIRVWNLSEPQSRSRRCNWRLRHITNLLNSPELHITGIAVCTDLPLPGRAGTREEENYEESALTLSWVILIPNASSGPSFKLAGLGGGNLAKNLPKPSISNGSSLFIIFTVFSFGIPRVFMKEKANCVLIPWCHIHPRDRKRNSGILSVEHLPAVDCPCVREMSSLSLSRQSSSIENWKTSNDSSDFWICSRILNSPWIFRSDY